MTGPRPGAASRLAERAGGLSEDVSGQLRELAGNLTKARQRLAELAAQLPPEAKREVAASAGCLAKAARSPRQFAAAVGEELERLLELWMTVSVRIRQLEAAGRVPDPDLLAEEVAAALTGHRGYSSPGRRIWQRVARRVARRLTRRWAAGLAPGVGIAYDAVDAQRTIRDVARLPVDGHPLAAPT